MALSQSKACACSKSMPCLSIRLVFIGVVINFHKYIVLTINTSVKQIVLTNKEKLLTNPTKTAYTNPALAKSSVSDWRRYFTVIQARHFFKRAIFVSAVSFYGGLCGGRKTATPVSSTPTRTVCHPYWREGGSVKLLTQETIMSKNQNSNLPIAPIAVINGKITLFTHVKLWVKGVRYA